MLVSVSYLETKGIQSCSCLVILSLLSLNIGHDGSHFLAVELQRADTGASKALTSRAEETTGVGRHLQVFTGLSETLIRSGVISRDQFECRSPLMILTESDRSLGSFQLLVERAELGDRVGDLNIINLTIWIGPKIKMMIPDDDGSLNASSPPGSGG